MVTHNSRNGSTVRSRTSKRRRGRSRSSRGPDPRNNVIRALLVRSGNRCAFHDCPHPVVNERDQFVAQVCHINAAGRGQRYDPNLSAEERRDIRNLLILCYAHHVETNNVQEWSPRRLRQLKMKHEKQCRRANFKPTETVVQQAREAFDSEWRRARELEELRHELTEGLVVKERRAAYLRGQLDNCYGPLSFLLETNAKFFAHSNRLFEISLELKPDADPGRSGVSNCITVYDTFRALIADNNKHALHVLRMAWGWIDHEDTDLLTEYVLDIYRQMVEPANPMPLDVYAIGSGGNIKPAQLIREEVVERLRKRITAKRAELRGLQGSR